MVAVVPCLVCGAPGRVASVRVPIPLCARHTAHANAAAHLARFLFG